MAENYEDLTRQKGEMEDTHLKQIDKMFLQHSELAFELNAKILETKEVYEEKIQVLQGECTDKMRDCSVIANDA